MYCDVGVDDDGRTALHFLDNTDTGVLPRRVIPRLSQGLHIFVPFPIIPPTARLPTPWLRVGLVARPLALVVAVWSQELVGVPP